MSHPQAPPISGSGPPPAGGYPAGTPYQHQPPPQGQGHWQQPPQQQPSPYQPYNQQQQQQQQQQQPQPASHTYGQPYQHQSPALGHTPSPLASQTPYGQPPAGSPGQPPTGAPANTPPGSGGAPHSAGFPPGVGGPASVAPPQGYAAQGYPGTVPQQGGLMGQVNHAFASGVPYIQTFSSKLTGKFNRITGHASAYQQHPAPGTYGQPGGYGQPAYGHPQQHQQQPDQIPVQQTQSPLHQQQQQPPPPYQQQQQPSPYTQPVQPPPPHQQQQPGSYSQPAQSVPPHQQQHSPYSQAPSPYPPTQPTTSAPAASPPPASVPAADPLIHSMGALSLGASTAASTSPPSASPAPTTAQPPPATQKWYLVDPASQQPTPEFRAVAALMFDSLNAHGNQHGFVDATKILGAWQANGLDAQWVELFAYDNYYSFSLMWSLSEIPHVLIPRTPSLVPPAASLGPTPSGPATATPFMPSTIPADPGNGKFNDAQLPTYVPALTVGGYTSSLFLDFFDDPASLPNLVRKQVGIASYSDHRLRNHTLPDLDAYDPSVPADLQSRAKAVRAAAVERAMAEVAKRRSGASTAPYKS